MLIRFIEFILGYREIKKRNQTVFGKNDAMKALIAKAKERKVIR